MKKNIQLVCKRLVLTIALLTSTMAVFAQTDMDAIMMNKNNFCTGIMYSSNNWKNYWEGTFKRDNQNLGTVSNQMIGVMGNYGLKDNLNLLFAIPYITTNSSMGTLAGQKGIQDLSLTIKWMPIEKKLGKGDFSLYTLATISSPVSNYLADYLPLSIGMHSRMAGARLMVDYQINNLFVTGSAALMMRNKVTIDRTSYYTTQMYYTNEVELPNMANFNLRAGYRSGRLIAEAIVDIMQTNGGFDITKNNMPFLSNQMNAKRIGVNFKYNIAAVDGLSLIGNGMYTIAGRNVGQTTSIGGGVFYIFDFTKKKKADETADKK